MELLITLAMKFWQWTVLIAVVIIAAIINVFDKKQKPNLKFNFKGMPKLQPCRSKPKAKDSGKESLCGCYQQETGCLQMTGSTT